jgi:pimeloyl-ACP methyl ester carboxylesterase
VTARVRDAVRDVGGIAVTERPAPLDGAALVVLVHGTLDRGRSMRRVVERLPAFHVITYDRRGYAGSIGAGPPTGLRQHADDLVTVLDGRRATVVGHSFGSHVAVLAGILRPDLVASVGLWEPPTPWMEWAPPDMKARVAAFAASPDPAVVAESTRRRMMGDEAWAALPASTRRECRAEGRAFTVDMGSEVEAPYDLAELHVPCLIGRGGRTTLDHNGTCARLAAILGCELFCADEAPHAAHVQSPDSFSEFARRAVALGQLERPGEDQPGK